MRLLIAREAVDAHLSVATDIVDPMAGFKRKARAAAKASGFYAKWLPSLLAGKGQLPGAYREFGQLANHLRFIERTSRKLARSTFYGMSRWQARLEHRQAFLGRLVDIGAELYAMAACCIYAMELRQPCGESVVELADVFCQQSRRRIAELFDRLWHNTDSVDCKLAGRALDQEFLWLDHGVIDPSIEGPWIAPVKTGPSERQDLRRRITS
jgi:hypothetical protein